VRIRLPSENPVYVMAGLALKSYLKVRQFPRNLAKRIVCEYALI
jgi:hypothetical protein